MCVCDRWIERLRDIIITHKRLPFQTVVVNDATLAKYIPRREENHDQMQWIAFYKVIIPSLWMLGYVSASCESLIEIETFALE